MMCTCTSSKAKRTSATTDTAAHHVVDSDIKERNSLGSTSQPSLTGRTPDRTPHSPVQVDSPIPHAPSSVSPVYNNPKDRALDPVVNQPSHLTSALTQETHHTTWLPTSNPTTNHNTTRNTSPHHRQPPVREATPQHQPDTPQKPTNRDPNKLPPRTNNPQATPTPTASPPPASRPQHPCPPTAATQTPLSNTHLPSTPSTPTAPPDLPTPLATPTHTHQHVRSTKRTKDDTATAPSARASPTTRTARTRAIGRVTRRMTDANGTGIRTSMSTRIIIMIRERGRIGGIAITMGSR